MDRFIIEKEWRISKSGFSIKTGWNDDRKIIVNCPVNIALRPFDNEAFREWIDNAELICNLYNSRLKKVDEITVAALQTRVLYLESKLTKVEADKSRMMNELKGVLYALQGRGMPNVQDIASMLQMTKDRLERRITAILAVMEVTI